MAACGALQGLLPGDPGDFPLEPQAPGMFGGFARPHCREFSGNQFAPGQTADSGGGKKSCIPEHHRNDDRSRKKARLPRHGSVPKIPKRRQCRRCELAGDCAVA